MGGRFYWWLGQVVDSKLWRENLTGNKTPSSKIPGWGYRYKVMIMGLHDQDADETFKEKLYWAQVMHSPWGGGEGASYQTPGIRQGSFVFGWFLDGIDKQLPIIMGVLGKNTLTKVEKLGVQTYAASSAYTTDGLTSTGDSDISTEKNSLLCKESVDNPNEECKADEVIIREHGKCFIVECVDPEEKSETKGIQLAIEKMQKEIAQVQKSLTDLPTAIALPIQKLDTSINDIIDKYTGDVSEKMNEIMSKVEYFSQEALTAKVLGLLANADPSDALKLGKEQQDAAARLACVFNKIKGDLARLIAAGIKNSLAKKQNRTPQRTNQTRPQGNNSGLIPPIPPEGFYTPMNPCETEDVIADVFSNVMGDITQGYQDAIIPLAAGSGTSTQGRLASILSQENVVTNLENGKLFGGLASALGAGLGIDAGQSGAITSALKSGNYAAALTSLVDFSGSNAAVGGLSTALQSIDNGDIIGAFQGLSGPLGIDSKLMGAVGGALGAIKGGDMASLTNALGNLGGAAPQILTDVLGGRLPLSGIDIGGFGALGGLDFDMALATTFMSTAAAFLECDPPDECPVNDTHTLSGGGKSKDQSKSEKVNNTGIMDKVKDGIKSTGIPTDLPSGSFGISPEGAQQALTNRLNAPSCLLYTSPSPRDS